MNEKLSRRALLQASIVTGVGAAAATYAASAESAQPRSKPIIHQAAPDQEVLRRYGGELGGSKLR